MSCRGTAHPCPCRPCIISPHKHTGLLVCNISLTVVQNTSQSTVACRNLPAATCMQSTYSNGTGYCRMPHHQKPNHKTPDTTTVVEWHSRTSINWCPGQIHEHKLIKFMRSAVLCPVRSSACNQFVVRITKVQTTLYNQGAHAPLRNMNVAA
jgi:hypothetical protein